MTSNKRVGPEWKKQMNKIPSDDHEEKEQKSLSDFENE